MMLKVLSLLLAGVFAVSAPSHAGLYKYVAPSGAVYYTSEPPNSNYKLIIKKNGERTKEYQDQLNQIAQKQKREAEAAAVERGIEEKAEKEAVFKELVEFDVPVKDTEFPRSLAGIRLGASRESLQSRLSCDGAARPDVLAICTVDGREDFRVLFKNNQADIIEYSRIWLSFAETLLGGLTSRFGAPEKSRSPARRSIRFFDAIEYATHYKWKDGGDQLVIAFRRIAALSLGTPRDYSQSIVLMRGTDGD